MDRLNDELTNPCDDARWWCDDGDCVGKSHYMGFWTTGVRNWIRAVYIDSYDSWNWAARDMEFLTVVDQSEGDTHAALQYNADHQVVDTSAETVVVNAYSKHLTLLITSNFGGDGVGVGDLELLGCPSDPDELAEVSDALHEFTGLKASTDYTFAVVARDTADKEATNFALLEVKTAAADVPGVPTDLEIDGTATTATTVSLAWEAPSWDGCSDIESYEVLDTATLTTQESAGPELTFTGLTPGVETTFRVRAGNSEGWGTYSDVSAEVTPKGAPEAVDAPTVEVVDDQTVYIAWEAPFNNGDAVTKYSVRRSDDDSVTETDGDLYIEWSGLTTGAEYTFAVRGANEEGWGSYGDESVTVVPAAAPDAPADVSVLGVSATTVTVGWSAAQDNGDTVTLYTISDGVHADQEAEAGSTTHEYTGLASGVSYDFQVTAWNSYGASPASDNAPGMPVDVPSAITAAPTVTAFSVDSLTLAWTAPTFINGAPVEAYVLQESVTLSNQSFDASTPQGTFAGLETGVAYALRVAARNSVGLADWSPWSADQAPLGPPSQMAPPVIVGYTSSSVDLQWTAPESTGGQTINTYTVTTSFGDDIVVGASTLELTVTGLGYFSYTFTVLATNAQGSSPASEASAAVTPQAVPSQPDAPTVTGFSLSSISLGWLAPAEANGPAVTLYTLTTVETGEQLNTTALAADVEDLATGDSFSFTVVAHNAEGASQTSDPSAAETPRAEPAAPAAPSVTAVTATSVTLAWAAPAVDNGAAIAEFLVSLGDRWENFGAAELSGTIDGLTPGQEYSFQVAARNNVGWGPLGNATAATPVGVPEQPAAPLIAGYDLDSVNLTWTAPFDNGDAVSEYWVGNVSTTSTELMLGGLETGRAYQFAVVAVNALGVSPPSELSATVTPSFLPDRVAQPTVTGYTATTVGLAWTAPDAKGRDITQYVVTASDGSVALAGGNETALDFPNLRTGDTYSFTVAAQTVEGVGTASEPSAEVSLGSVLVFVRNGSVSWSADAFATTVFDRLNVSLVEGGPLLPLNATEALLPASVLPCELAVVTVTYFNSNNTRLQGASDPFVPLDVCPHLCESNETAWIDPSRARPFQPTACDGDWTVTADADAAEWATETRVADDRGSWAVLGAPLLPGASTTTTLTTHAGTVVADVVLNVTSAAEWSVAGLLAVADGRVDASEAMPDWPVGVADATVAMRINELSTAITGAPAADVNHIVDVAGGEIGVAVVPARATVEWLVDDAGNWSATPPSPGADEGAHSAQARAVVDWWGVDESPARATWTYDVTPPLALVTLGPPALSASPLAQFTLDATEKPAQLSYWLPGGRGAGVADLVTNTTGEPETPAGIIEAGPVTAQPIQVTDVDGNLQYALDYGAYADLPVAADVADGWHAVHVRATTASGIEDPTPEAAAVLVQVVVDDTPPETALLAAPRAEEWNTTLEFVFDACAGNTFEASFDGGQAWEAVDGCGLVVRDAPLGLYVALFRATDAAGNVDPTPAAVAFQVVEWPEPETFFAQRPDAFVVETEAVLEPGCDTDGDDDDCQFEYSLDLGATWSAFTVLELTGLEPGLHVVHARATSMGRTDATPAVCAWQVVEQPTAALDVAPPSDGTEIPVPVFVVAVDGPASDCALQYAVADLLRGGTAASGSVAGLSVVLDALDVGEYELAVDVVCEVAVGSLTHTWRVSSGDGGASLSTLDVDGEGDFGMWVFATDPAGNEGPRVVYNWTVDSTAPASNLTWPHAELVSYGTFGFELACSEDPCSALALLDGAESDLANVTDGAYAVSIAPVDEAGNVGAAHERSVTVDTAPPALEVRWVGGLVFTVDCADLTGCVSVESDLDGELAAALLTLSAGMADGDYSVSVTATDGVGLSSVAAAAFVVDTQAPTTAVALAPPRFVASVDVDDVAFNCTDERGECAVNTSVPLPLHGLAQGEHNVTGCAYDPAGNVDPVCALVSFVVDTEPPANVTLSLEYLSSMSAVLSANSDVAALELAAAVANLEFSGDDWQLTGADGAYAPCFVARDEAGNAAAEEVCVDVVFDSVPPAMEADAAEQVTFARAAEFAVSVVEPNLVACSCAGGNCTVASVAASTLGLTATVQAFVAGDVVEAAVNMTVSCVDVHGNSGSVSLQWAVDRAPPVLELASVASLYNERNLSFAFSVADTHSVAVTCNGLVCESPFDMALLEDGAHSLVVAAVDAVGNAASSGADFAVDATPPILWLDEDFPEVTSEPSVTLAFRCITEKPSCAVEDPDTDPDCQFATLVDYAGGFSDWSDATSLSTTVDRGEHIIVVRAVDAAQNVVEEYVTWVFDQEVELNLVSTPPLVTGVSWANFTVNCTEESAVIEYRLVGDSEYTVAGSVDPETHELSFQVTGLADNTAPSILIRIADVELDDTAFSWTFTHCDDESEYETVDDDGALVCHSCPGGVQCATYSPDNPLAFDVLREGFWLPESQNIYACMVAEACAGAEGCAEGYSGVLCAVCADGYAATLQGECHACEGKAGVGATVALVAAGGTLLAVAAAYLVKKSLQTNSNARSVSTLKIMANYFLMMSILRDLQLDWGSILNTVFSYMGVASGGGVKEVQLVNCAIPVDTFVQYGLLFSVMPLVVVLPSIAIGAATGLLRFALWRRGEKQPKNVVIWGVKASFLVRQCMLTLAYFAYPVVVTTALRVLHCREVEGRWYLVDDFSKHCDGPEYQPYYALAIATLVIVAPGVPLGIWACMARFKEGMFTTDLKRKQQFFFFFGEFKPEWYWWEVTVMTRKVCMAAVSVMLSNAGEGWQVYAGTWILLASFVGQVTCLPHHDALQRRLETMAQATVLASLLLGQAIALSDNADDRAAYRALILALNLLVMNGLGLVLGREIWHDAQEKMHLGDLHLSTRVRSVSKLRKQPQPGGDDVEMRVFTDNPILAGGNPILAGGNPILAGGKRIEA